MSFPFILPVADSGISYAFSHSDFIGQSICIFLFCMSIVIWVIMLEKCITLNKAKKDTAGFSRLFLEKKNPLHLKGASERDRSPAARVYEAAVGRIDEFGIEVPGGGRRALSDDELEVIKATMSQEIEKQISFMEKGMILLATAVSASPFLGLFGTVWGITIAFTNLAMAGRADIQTLAPGVAGALLTTVAGLVVAIPSLVGYNIVSTLLKRITVQLDNFADEVAARFKIEQLDSIQAYRERK